MPKLFLEQMFLKYMAEEKFISPDDLKQLYINEHKSIREIARIYHVTHGIIGTKLKKLGINIRPFNDAQYYESRKRKSFPHDGQKRDYIIKMELYLGRPLDKEEVVHHIDRNRKNNDISNLYLFKNQFIHGAYHGYIRNNKYITPYEFVQQYSDVYDKISDYNFLYNEYITLNKSANQISKENHPVSRTIIVKKLKQYGIYDLRQPTIN